MTATRICTLSFSILALCLAQGLLAADGDAGPGSSRLQVGVGWPDLRLRGNVYKSLDLEAKAAFSSEALTYGGRLYWRAYDRGALGLMLGLEGGALSFNTADGLSGNGTYYEPFVGLQGAFSKRWSALVDAGPAFINVSSQGQSLADQQWVVSAAVYFSLF